MSSTNILFDSDRWEITAQESKIVYYLGQKSLFIKGGLAIVKDAEFTDGVIEYDVAFSRQASFIGGVWRLQNLNNYEVFYMRSLQSGNPDAIQYMPFFNGLRSWKLYSEEGYIAPFQYTFDEWMHVKIIVLGKNAEVYIQDMDNPVLVIPELKHNIQPGKVGLWVMEDWAPCHFANFSYQSKADISDLSLKNQVKDPEQATPGTIISWWISKTFDEKWLNGKFQLTENDKQQLNWYESPVKCEPSGLLNLATVQGIEEAKNAIFARTIIVSEKKQIKPIQLGFCDIVKVYLNDQLIYTGNNVVFSRNYKFLGTIGYFDELYLPLAEGENELSIAVIETDYRDGWGLQAKFEDNQGISFKSSPAIAKKVGLNAWQRMLRAIANSF